MELTSRLAGQRAVASKANVQAIVSTSLAKSKAASVASLKVSRVFAKHKMAYEDGELVS